MSAKPNLFHRLGNAWTVFRSGLPSSWFDHAPVDGGRGNSQLQRPYAESAWVMRAIKKIAQPIAAVPLEFYEGDSEIEDPALAAFWKQPAIGLRLPDFVEATVIWLKLRGEAFWIMGDSALRPFPEVSPAYEPMILARPDRMTPFMDGGELRGWLFTDGAKVRHTLLKEQVIHLKYYNPYDDVRGLAEYEAVRIATEADYAAGLYSRNLMENNGDTGPIIASKSGMLQDDQRNQIISQLRMKREYALRGEFRAAFLTSDVTVENPSAVTADANFAAMRLGNRNEIFVGLGVPPSMADKMESYSIGSASDWFILIFETCVPTAGKIAAGIEEVLKRQTGRELEACFEFEEHPVMQQVRRERLDSLEKLWSKGMPVEAINDYLSLGLQPFEGWEVGYLPFGVIPVNEQKPVPDEQTDPNLSEPVEEMLRVLRSGRGSATRSAEEVESAAAQSAALQDESIIERCACCDHTAQVRADAAADFQKDRPDKERRLWRKHMRSRLPAIRDYESRFSRMLMIARTEVLGKLNASDLGKGARVSDPQRGGSQSRGPVTKAAAADFLFNLADFSQKFLATMRAAGMNTLQTAGDQLFAEIGKDDPWQMPPAEALMFLERRKNRISNVPDDVWERIKGTLQEGITGGDTIEQLSRRVRGEFNSINRAQGLRIAMTEVAAAYGSARQVAMQQAGITRKQWLTSGNSNVRLAHQAMNNATVDVDENFTVINPKTGETDEVAYPGDSSGAPWNVINCHCVSIAVESEEAT